jgi:hypothetical protein
MTDMNDFMEVENRTDTANEMDENTRSIYIKDMMYLFFKLLMFVILGGVFYYLFKNQNSSEMVSQITEKVQVVGKAVRDKMEPKDIVKV